MKLDVKLFARARDLAGTGQAVVELSLPATVGTLRSALVRDFPALAAVAPTLLVAVDMDYAADSTPLLPHSDVACFPPVSGG